VAFAGCAEATALDVLAVPDAEELEPLLPQAASSRAAATAGTMSG